MASSLNILKADKAWASWCFDNGRNLIIDLSSNWVIVLVKILSKGLSDIKFIEIGPVKAFLLNHNGCFTCLAKPHDFTI